MAEISRVRDERRYRASVVAIARELLKEHNEGQCLIFLGAGASLDASKPHLPSASELSKHLADECQLEWHDYIPLSTIAFHYEYYYKRDQLNRFLQERLSDPAIAPSSTLERLVKIVKILEGPPGQPRTVFVICTNYDQHFERAYETVSARPPDVIVYNGGVDANDDQGVLYSGLSVTSNWLPRARTYLFKIHGCISQPGRRNLVITEEDYVNFLSNAMSYDDRKRLLKYSTMRFSECPILFVGYSLSDWNFRVVFKATAEKYARDCYAVQYFPETTGPKRSAWDAAVDFWGSKRVDVINEDGAVFMQDLLDAVIQESAKARPGTATTRA